MLPGMEMPPHRRLHLACGSHRLPEPWENYDKDVDLRRPLPFEPGTAAFVLCEHAIEHLSFGRAMAMLSDVLRVLEPGGVLRLCFPDATRASLRLADYAAFLRDRGLLVGEGEPHVLRHVLLGWQHQSAWTGPLARAALEALGFVDIWEVKYGESQRPELHGVDGHHHSVGLPIAQAETTCVEAVRP